MSIHNLQKKAIKIVFFAEIFPSKSETWVHNEINELIQLGCNIHIFATHPKPEVIPEEHINLAKITTYLDNKRFTLHSIISVFRNTNLLLSITKGIITDCIGNRHRAQVIRDLLFTIRFLPALTDFKPDFVISHFAGTRTNLALFYHFQTSTPFLFKMHAADVFNRPALFKLKVEKADHCLTISEYNINFINKRDLDIDTRGFLKHECGIDLNEFGFIENRKTQELPHLLAVGRLIPMKGFKYLIDACHLLVEQGIDFRLTIIGHGPEQQLLRKQVEDLSLSHIVTIKGYQPPSIIRQTLLESDIFVLPAVWDKIAKTQDGIPVALMEAMAMGVPVVSTETSGIPELICDEVNGFLAIPESAESLSEKLYKCLTLDNQEKITLTKKARESVEKKHDIEKLTIKLLTLIKQSIVS